MENDLKHAFGDRNNSEFVISDAGKVIISRSWSKPEELRSDLENLVGKSETTTQAKSPARSTSSRSSFAKGVVPRVTRPSGAVALKVKNVSTNEENPLYVKLRAEAARDVINGGAGEMYIGFHLDPIYKVHWNNLAAPLKFSIEAPDGVEMTTNSGEAPAVEAKADIDPREFLVKISGAGSEPLKLTVDYFACDDDDAWCKAVTQEYQITFSEDRDGGRVSAGGGSKGKGKGSMKGKGRGNPEQIFSMMDQNEDGKIAKDEARGRMAERFGQIDTNSDGFVSKEELKARFGRR